jgi:hypothetical protein
VTETIEGTAQLAAGASLDAKLNAALAAAQGQFPRIEASKTANVRGKDGKPGYSYSYADLADIFAAVRPVLSKNGLAITQRTSRGDQDRTGLRTELRHVAGGVLASETEISVSPSNTQAFGSALTYLRRYELVTLLGIAPDGDTGGDGAPAQATDRPHGPEAELELRQQASATLTDLYNGNEDAARAMWAHIKTMCGGYMPHAAAAALVTVAAPPEKPSTEAAS